MICPYCKGQHTLSQCKRWLAKPSEMGSQQAGQQVEALFLREPRCAWPARGIGRTYVPLLLRTRCRQPTKGPRSRLLRMDGHSFGYVLRQAVHRVFEPRSLTVAASCISPICTVQLPEPDMVRRIGFGVIGAEPFATVGGHLKFRRHMAPLMGEILKTRPAQRAAELRRTGSAEHYRKRMTVREAEFHGLTSLVVEIAVSGAGLGAISGLLVCALGDSFSIVATDFLPGAAVQPHRVALRQFVSNRANRLTGSDCALLDQIRQVSVDNVAVDEAQRTSPDGCLNLSHFLSPVAGRPVQPMTRL
jgi:hypothetical protein